MKILNTVILILVLISCGKSKGNPTPAPVPKTPVLSIANASQARDNSATTDLRFFINVQNSSATPITVKYNTVDGTAKSGSDYIAQNGTLNIPANSMSSFIDIPVKGDSTRDAEKIFYVQLSNPTNAAISGEGKGAGTIICDGLYLPVDNSGYSTPLTYPGYTLSWAEEFNGPVLDNTSWNYETGGSGWGNNELEYYTNSPKNSFVTKGGYLVLEARKETFGNRNYTSARLQTLGKKDFTYGRVDIRAKLPKGKGIWPALWMLGSNIATTPWPASGEIDIMEVLGHEANKTYGTAHWGNVGAPSTHIGGNYVLPSGDFSQTFHVFSLIWTENKLEWYIDDVKFYTVNKSDVNGNYPFDKPFFFILNVAVGGDWPGSPDANTPFPQRMIVDYIRVFQ